MGTTTVPAARLITTLPGALASSRDSTELPGHDVIDEFCDAGPQSRPAVGPSDQSGEGAGQELRFELQRIGARAARASARSWRPGLCPRSSPTQPSRGACGSPSSSSSGADSWGDQLDCVTPAEREGSIVSGLARDARASRGREPVGASSGGCTSQCASTHAHLAATAGGRCPPRPDPTSSTSRGEAGSRFAPAGRYRRVLKRDGLAMMGRV
jgi:hypothetical protein